MSFGLLKLVSHSKVLCTLIASMSRPTPRRLFPFYQLSPNLRGEGTRTARATPKRFCTTNSIWFHAKSGGYSTPSAHRLTSLFLHSTSTLLLELTQVQKFIECFLINLHALALNAVMQRAPRPCAHVRNHERLSTNSIRG